MKTLRIRTKEGIIGAMDVLYPLIAEYLDDPAHKDKGVTLTLGTMDWISWSQMKLVNKLCGEVAKQATLHGAKMSKDDWRHIFVAGLRKDQKTVAGLDGGLILLGGSSRELSRKETGELIELVYSWGSNNGVTFSENPNDQKT